MTYIKQGLRVRWFGVWHLDSVVVVMKRVAVKPTLARLDVFSWSLFKKTSTEPDTRNKPYTLNPKTRTNIHENQTTTKPSTQEELGNKSHRQLGQPTSF